MAYKRERKVYRLVFADGDMAGFEITVRGLSSEEFLRLTKFAATAQDIDTTSAKDIGDIVPAVGDVFSMLAGNTVQWNLEDDDGPVPVSADAVKNQDWEFVMAITNEWMTAMAGVSPPLPASSNGSARLQEASIPMDVLSPSRSN